MNSDLERTLDHLSSIENERAPILSLYLTLDPRHDDWRSIRPRLKNLLVPVENLAASGELGHESSTELRETVESVLAKSTSLERLRSEGVALYVAPGIGLSEQIDVPARIWDCAIVGPAPYLRPMRAALDGLRRTEAVVVLDARRAEIFTSSAGELLDRQVLEAEELRKSNLAGWYGLDELRNRQHSEEVRHQLFREVAEILERMCRDRDIDLVLLGGQHEITQAALPFLDPRVQAMTETFVIDLHTLTPEILAARVAELERSYADRVTAREVEEISSIAAAGGLAVVGVDAVLAAASRHAVARLLIQGGALRPGAVCTRCGALSLPENHCSVCGDATRQVPDIFEELTRSVVEAGGTVAHTMTETSLATDLVAARLRYRV